MKILELVKSKTKLMCQKFPLMTKPKHLSINFAICDFFLIQDNFDVQTGIVVYF